MVPDTAFHKQKVACFWSWCSVPSPEFRGSSVPLSLGRMETSVSLFFSSSVWMPFSFRFVRISLLFIHSSYDRFLIGRNGSYGHQGWKMNQLTFPWSHRVQIGSWRMGKWLWQGILQSWAGEICFCTYTCWWGKDKQKIEQYFFSDSSKKY